MGIYILVRLQSPCNSVFWATCDHLQCVLLVRSFLWLGFYNVCAITTTGRIDSDLYSPRIWLIYLWTAKIFSASLNTHSQLLNGLSHFPQHVHITAKMFCVFELLITFFFMKQVRRFFCKQCGVYVQCTYMYSV